MEELLNYERLIYSVISKYTNRFDKEDLFQVGMIGLIEAYKNYNSSFNTKFSTYAYYYILGEVNKYIRESSSLKLSRDLLRLKQKIIKTKEIMTQRLGRSPSNLEIALFLEIEEEKIEEALSISEVVNIDNEELEYNSSFKVEDSSLSPEILDLKVALGQLNEEEKRIVLKRYYEELTQSEASKELGMSQVQVSRKEAKVLKKLRVKLENT